MHIYFSNILSNDRQKSSLVLWINFQLVSVNFKRMIQKNLQNTKKAPFELNLKTA